MPVTPANGIRLHTQRLGSTGAPVVMLHGMMIGTLSSWYFSVAPRLAPRHRVLLYDLRGHGLSDRPASGYGVRSMARDLESLVEGFSDEAVALVGHSYGGVIALRYAIDHPQRVTRLVLVDSPLPVLSPDVLTFFHARSVEELLDLLPGSQRVVIERDGKRAGGRLGRQLWELATETSMEQDIVAEADIPDAEIASFQRPVLLCYGTASEYTATSCARLARLLPGARVKMIEGDHYLPFESPVALGDAVLEFLDE